MHLKLAAVNFNETQLPNWNTDLETDWGSIDGDELDLVGEPIDLSSLNILEMGSRNESVRNVIHTTPPNDHYGYSGDFTVNEEVDIDKMMDEDLVAVPE